MLPLLSCMTVRTLFRLILAILVPLLSGCGRDAVDPSEIHDYMTIMSSAEAADITPSQTIEDRYGYRWVRSSNRLFIYDGTNYVQCIRTDDPGSLSSSHVNSIMADTHGDIWVATQLGIDRYDFPSRTFMHYGLEDSNHYILDMDQGSDGEIYAVSRLFLFRLDRNEGSFKKMMALKPTGEKVGLSVDDDGSVWIDYRNSQDRISFLSGKPVIMESVATASEDLSRAVVIGNRPLLTELERRNITDIENQGDIIWAVTTDFILLKFSYSENRLVGEYPVSSITGEIPEQHVRLTAYDDGRMLLFTYGSIFLLDTSPESGPELECTYDISFNPKASGSLDSGGGLWISGAGAAIYHAPAAGRATLVQDFRKITEGLPATSIDGWRSIVLDDGTIAFGFSDIGIVLLDPRDGEPRLTRLPRDIKQLFINNLYEDSSGRIWVSTSDNGLLIYDRKNDLYFHPEPLKKCLVISVTEDCKGIVYINTTSGIHIFKDGRFLNLWGNSGETQEAMVTMPDGQVFLKHNRHFLRLNEMAEEGPGHDMGPLSIILCSSDRMVSRFNSEHAGNTVKLRFTSHPTQMSIYPSCLEWYSNRATNYFYRIGGGDWLRLMNSPGIPLYRLHFGTNRIEVKAADVATGVEGEPILLRLHIRRPAYHYILASSALAAALALFILLGQRRRRQEENERFRENIDFFSNMSHEFRTPLTLVNGAVESLASSDRIGGNEARLVKVIQRNSARMTKLVTQMLDFNKIDHNALQLSVSPCNVASLMHRIADMFAVGAEQKSIDLHLEGCEKPLNAWIDSDKVEKMMFNLISNALKYTPPSGKVTIRAGMDGDMLHLDVEDTGIGIPDEMHEAIFERFTRAREGRKVASGSGIGLYYTRALAGIHHGAVSVRNMPGGGSGFTITLPAGEASYSDSEKGGEQSTFATIEGQAVQSEFIVSGHESQGQEEKPSVLIIDDDYEMVHYLKMLLEKDYAVDFRYDAVSGYALMTKKMPDIVICDVMMVDVDGYQFCRMVKENDSTSHIPIVLLTAKATIQDQITGLSEGADAYVVKPFNNNYLLTVLSSILENRRRLQKIFQNTTKMPEEAINGTSDKDKQFLERLYAIMEESLSQGELDVDTISAKLGYSRTKLFYKIKAIVGQTPNEFFTTYKLNKSLELLRSGKYKISAVAEMVGFSSASHFSNLFKKKFGMLPSQYRE